MSSKIDLLHVTLCGPSDVQKEIDIAREVITDWNTQHGDGLGLFVKHQHWITDAYPDASERGQAVINRQLIDSADILVCVFWSRFGSPTGTADSGTEEEIRRAIALGKHVTIYFSDLEPLPPSADAAQLRRLESFRREMLSKSLSWPFRSRKEFQDQLTTHVAKIVHALRPKTAPKQKATRSEKSVEQKIIGGTGNIQIGGDVENIHHYTAPPKLNVTLERRPDSISPRQENQIHEWIETLANATTDKSRTEAFKEWWGRFRNKFKVAKCEALPSEDFPKVKAWYRQQMGILTRGLKRKAPGQWQNSRIGSIKAAMKEMGRTNDDYYPELAARLKITPFESLKELTKTNLERVYSRVLADRRNG